MQYYAFKITDSNIGTDVYQLYSQISGKKLE